MRVNMKNSLSIMALVFFTISLTASNCSAGCLASRFVTGRALIYGIESTTSSVDLTTETRIQKIANQFDDFKTSPALVTQVAQALAHPRTTGTVEWANKIGADGSFVTGILDGIKLQLVPPHGQSKIIVNPDVWEFNTLTGPVRASVLFNLPFTTAFDEKMTTYVVAGLNEVLSPSDLKEIKQFVLDNRNQPSLVASATTSLLATVYVNQTDDSDFVKKLWDDYPKAKSDVLFFCIFAKNNSRIMQLGRDISEEVYGLCPSLEGNHEQRSFTSLVTKFMQFHLDNPIVNRLACKVIENPISFYNDRTELLYTLVRSKEHFPWTAEVLNRVRDNCELTSAALNLR